MKYILEERFILSEADANSKPKSLTDDEANVDNNDQSVNNDTDWEQRYKACKTQDDFNKFWEAFAQDLFNDPTGKTKKLCPALATFLPSCQDGWDVDENPVLGFLKNVADGEINGLSVAHINYSSLTSIISAYKEHILSKTALLEAGKSKLLLAFPEFYTYTATDQMSYLKLQNAILSKQVDFASCCVDQQSKRLLPFKQARKKAKNTGVEEDTVVSSDAVDSLVKATSEAEALIAFACSYDIFKVLMPEVFKNIAKLVKAEALDALRNKATNLTPEQISKWRKKILPAQAKYNAKSAAKLLLSFAQKAGLKLANTNTSDTGVTSS